MLEFLSKQTLKFKNQVYNYKQNLKGSIAYTYILTCDGQKSVLKLTDHQTAETRILSHINQKDPDLRISKLLSSGNLKVKWNDHVPVISNNKQPYLNSSDIYYVHLSYIKGKVLSDINADELPNQKIQEILFSLIDLLADLSHLNISHNDIRDDNVVVYKNQAYLIDFGMSIFITNSDVFSVVDVHICSKILYDDDIPDEDIEVADSQQIERDREFYKMLVQRHYPI